MRRRVEPERAELVVVTAAQSVCPACGGKLEIYQHRQRYVQGLERYVRLVRRDKKCVRDACGGPKPIFRPPEDLRLALPRRTYGLDVTLMIGERHLRGESLGSIGLDLNALGVPIHQTQVGRVFRDFLAVSNLTLGDDRQLREKLRRQGGIALQADGVQFDAQSPVLYVAWDALSGQPLYAERKEYRSADDLRSVLEHVKAMDVPIIGVISDKEKGLVPAIEAVFPEAPRQYCHTHYFKNCAMPLKPDLTALHASVAARAERVRKIAVGLHKQDLKDAKHEESGRDTGAISPGATTTGDLERVADGKGEPVRDVVRKINEFVRVSSRITGRAPFDPPELKQHKRLEEARELVDELRAPKKKRKTGRVARWVGGLPLAEPTSDGA